MIFRRDFKFKSKDFLRGRLLHWKAVQSLIVSVIKSLQLSLFSCVDISKPAQEPIFHFFTLLKFQRTSRSFIFRSSILLTVVCIEIFNITVTACGSTICDLENLPTLWCDWVSGGHLLSACQLYLRRWFLIHSVSTLWVAITARAEKVKYRSMQVEFYTQVFGVGVYLTRL